MELDNRDQLVKSASTSLNSKVVFQQSSILAPLAVEAVLKVIEPGILLFLHFNFCNCYIFVFLIMN